MLNYINNNRTDCEILLIIYYYKWNLNKNNILINIINNIYN